MSSDKQSMGMLAADAPRYGKNPSDAYYQLNGAGGDATNVVIDGTLEVKGATTLDSTLNVTGDVTLTGNLTAVAPTSLVSINALDVANDVSVSGDLLANGNLTATETITINPADETQDPTFVQYSASSTPGLFANTISLGNTTGVAPALPWNKSLGDCSLTYPQGGLLLGFPNTQALTGDSIAVFGDTLPDIVPMVGNKYFCSVFWQIPVTTGTYSNTIRISNPLIATAGLVYISPLDDGTNDIDTVNGPTFQPECCIGSGYIPVALSTGSPSPQFAMQANTPNGIGAYTINRATNILSIPISNVNLNPATALPYNTLRNAVGGPYTMRFCIMIL